MRKTTKIAIKAIMETSNILKKRLQKKKKEFIKVNGEFQNIVTDVDFLAENKIYAIIQKTYPSHAILSEETRKNINPQKEKHLWIVDPIDGSIAFAAGLPFYSVAIAYLLDQQLISSALYLAATDEILWAEIGKGAYVGRKKIRVKNLPWEKCVIALDPGNQRRKEIMATIAPSLSAGIRFLQITSGEAGNLGLIARGNIQGLVCATPEVWDYAAGIHLVQEAGGIVSDFKGKPYKMFSISGHIAAAPTIHREILRYTQSFR